MWRKYESLQVQELHSGLQVFAESRDFEIVSAGSLLDRFNNSIDPREPLSAKPLGMALNPTVRGCRVYMYDDVWVVAYRQNFRVLIIKHNRYASGPHVAKLQYQSYQTGQLFWIATLQISECMFYSEEAINLHLFTHVLNKSWYLSDKSRKDHVTV